MKRFFRILKKAWNEVFEQAAKESHYQCSFLGALGSIASIALPAIGSLFGKGDKKGGGFPWESVLGAGGALISGLAGSDKGYSPEEQQKAKYKYELKLMQDRRAMLEEAGIKPQTPRFESYSKLHVLAPFLNKMIIGSFGDIMGQESMQKYGIDLGSTLQQMGANPQEPPQGGGGFPPIGGQPPWFKRSMGGI